MITDASTSNLVFRSFEGLFTPDSCLLKGTKRQYLIDKKIIDERKITADDIRLYTHIHFINAMIDLEDDICIDIEKAFL